MVSAWHTVAFVIMLLPVSLCAKLASKCTSCKCCCCCCWWTRFLLLLLLLLLSLHSILYANMKIYMEWYIYTLTKDEYICCACIYNLQSLIHLRCELLTKECKGDNDKKGDGGGVWLYFVRYTFSHSITVPVPLPYESFEIKFGCHHYTTPNTHINTTREHKHTHTRKHYCVRTYEQEEQPREG